MHGAFNKKGPVDDLERRITLLLCRNILQAIGSFDISLESNPGEAGEKHFRLNVKFSAVLKVLFCHP